MLLFLGFALLGFPDTVGRFAIRSFALVIAVPALIILVMAIRQKSYVPVVLSVIFLLTALRVVMDPTLLLSYVGACLIFSSAVHLLLVRKPQVWISSGVTAVLGVLALFNAQASLWITSVILGIIVVGVAVLLIFVRSALIRSWDFDLRSEHKVKTKIQILEHEYEEANVKEVDESGERF